MFMIWSLQWRTILQHWRSWTTVQREALHRCGSIIHLWPRTRSRSSCYYAKLKNTENNIQVCTYEYRRFHSSFSPVFISADFVQVGYCFLCFSTMHSSNCFCSSFLVRDELYCCVNAMVLSALLFYLHCWRIVLHCKEQIINIVRQYNVILSKN